MFSLFVELILKLSFAVFSLSIASCCTTDHFFRTHGVNAHCLYAFEIKHVAWRQPHACALVVRADFRYITRTGIYRARSVCYI